MGKFFLKLMAFAAVFNVGVTVGNAADQGKTTAKQVVDTFQNQLIDVMKNGKALGFKGRYDKLKDSVTNSHDLTKIARIIVGKEWEKLTRSAAATVCRCFHQAQHRLIRPQLQGL